MKLTTAWNSLPFNVRQHLFERLRDRKIIEADLYKLQFWSSLLGLTCLTEIGSRISVPSN